MLVLPLGPSNIHAAPAKSTYTQRLVFWEGEAVVVEGHGRRDACVLRVDAPVLALHWVAGPGTRQIGLGFKALILRVLVGLPELGARLERLPWLEHGARQLRHPVWPFYRLGVLRPVSVQDLLDMSTPCYGVI